MRNNFVNNAVDSLRTACVLAVEQTQYFVDSMRVNNSTTAAYTQPFPAQYTALSTAKHAQFSSVKLTFYTPSPALIKTTNFLIER